MWKVSIEDDQANQTVVDLVRDEYSIGRDAANTVRLTERNISRKHALLRRNGAGWLVKDLSSYNGCYVNGVRVSSEHHLKHGDLLQLGDYRLELLDDAVQLKATDPESKTATLPGRQSQTIRDLPIRLVMIAGPSVGASFPLLEKRIVIGRGEDCDLPINDTSVSRIHAEIHQIEGGQYEVVDRDSSNGVRVNGVELKKAILDAGDVIELGDVQLKFVPAGQIFHMQEPLARRNSLTPGASDRQGPPRGRARLAAAVVGIAAAGVLTAVALRRAPEETMPAPVAEVSPAARALDEARALLAAGDVEGALRKSREIPEDSNLRESAVWKEIQGKWADGVFAQAARETDRTKKRALLDQIAKSPDVGSMLRKRAANEIATLDADSVGIEDLPSAEKGSASAAAPAATPVKATGPAPKSATPERQPAEPPSSSPAPAQTAAKRKNEVKGGLVRDTPF